MLRPSFPLPQVEDYPIGKLIFCWSPKKASYHVVKVTGILIQTPYIPPFLSVEQVGKNEPDLIMFNPQTQTWSHPSN